VQVRKTNHKGAEGEKGKKKHRLKSSYSPPNLGSMRLRGSFLLILVITHIVIFSPIDLPVAGESGGITEKFRSFVIYFVFMVIKPHRYSILEDLYGIRSGFYTEKPGSACSNQL
jgi:hypothetical protein